MATPIVIVLDLLCRKNVEAATCTKTVKIHPFCFGCFIAVFHRTLFVEWDNKLIQLQQKTTAIKISRMSNG